MYLPVKASLWVYLLKLESEKPRSFLRRNQSVQTHLPVGSPMLSQRAVPQHPQPGFTLLRILSSSDAFREPKSFMSIEYNGHLWVLFIISEFDAGEKKKKRLLL